MTNKNSYKGGIFKMDEFKENDVYPDIYDENKNNYKGGILEMKERYSLDNLKYNNYDEALNDVENVFNEMVLNIYDDLDLLKSNDEYDYIERVINMYFKTLNYCVELKMKQFDEFIKVTNVVDKYREIGYALENIENTVNEMECEK